MDHFIESLMNLLPEAERKGFAESVTSMLEEARAEIRAEEEKAFEAKLAAAQEGFAEELKEAETTGYEGYEKATGIIMDLRARLAKANEEREAEVAEVCEEAHAKLEEEKAKIETLDSQLREEYEASYAAKYEDLVDSVDSYMQYKVAQIVESVRTEVINDPRTVEHKVVLDRVLESLGPYTNNEARAVSKTNKMLEESQREASDLKANIRLLEERNIRLNSDNRKLTESVRKAEATITESRKADEKKEKTLVETKAKNTEGKGKIVTEDRVINEPVVPAVEPNMTLEGVDPQMIALSKGLN